VLYGFLVLVENEDGEILMTIKRLILSLLLLLRAGEECYGGSVARLPVL
jgi:hypothetical protein